MTTVALKITSGIPVPPRKHGQGRAGMLAAMQPGDSVFLANRKLGAALAHQYRKTRGWTMTTRTLTEGGTAGVRVWRIS